MEYKCLCPKKNGIIVNPTTKIIKGIFIFHLQIKIGLLDHPRPKYKPQKIYDGTDTRNDYTKWNVSNEVIRK